MYRLHKPYTPPRPGVTGRSDISKALYARQYIKTLCTTCNTCGVLFKPCVDFPLFYKFPKCPRCDPHQKLSRCPYDLIPTEFSREEFAKVLEILHKKKCIYPIYSAVFGEITKLRQPNTEKEAIIRAGTKKVVRFDTSTAVQTTNRKHTVNQHTQTPSCKLSTENI